MMAVVFIVAVIGAGISEIWFLYRVAQTGFAWFLACFFIPIVRIFWLIHNWEDGKMPFLSGLLCGLVAILAVLGGGTPRFFDDLGKEESQKSQAVDTQTREVASSGYTSTYQGPENYGEDGYGSNVASYEMLSRGTPPPTATPDSTTPAIKGALGKLLSVAQLTSPTAAQAAAVPSPKATPQPQTMDAILAKVRQTGKPQLKGEYSVIPTEGSQPVALSPTPKKDEAKKASESDSITFGEESFSSFKQAGTAGTPLGYQPATGRASATPYR